ncbi:MAG TPA: helix-turn-helix domain-containing protein [Amycolatopsis sp.]|uniref:helix-turn-helix domain-containing protein n=1 Tax=Amycolatopsis sp. TaxID=37632 RepID=UPI002B49D788|nr:helix-turn-helix domain-containing protein [Amycolatopsis sp.]HKS48841.1 helix-turn-helix domain-containing protein [Amycolatopsis sp.]
MSNAAVRVGVGTRFSYDGEVVEVVELLAAPAGNEVVLKNVASQRIIRVSVRELLTSDRARIIPAGPGPSADDPQELASALLAELTDTERQQLRERAAHVREVLTGYRLGMAELATEGEPSPEFEPSLPLTTRYRAKAAELNITMRTVQQWVSDFHGNGEAGLLPKKDLARNSAAATVENDQP